MGTSNGNPVNGDYNDATALNAEYAEAIEGIQPTDSQGAPVPVYLVEPAPTRDLPPVGWSVGGRTIANDGVGHLLVSSHIARVDLVVVNDSAVTVRVGPSQAIAMSEDAFTLLAGGSLVLQARTRVYAYAPNGAAHLSYSQQTRDGEGR